MSYPINDIFEGAAELLLKHGEREFEHHDIEFGCSDIYINYGGYHYHIVDKNGHVYTISRLKRSDNNGQN